MPDQEWSAEDILVTLAKGRGDLDAETPTTPELVEQLTQLAAEGIERERTRRSRELLEGDVEVDPDLMDIGDEVAEEVATEYLKTSSRSQGTRLKLVDAASQGAKSRFTDEQQANAAQRAQDLMLERGISKSQAAGIAGAELDVGPSTIATWAIKHGIDLGGFIAKRSRGSDWSLQKREELFGRQMDAVSLLTDRALVWIQHPEDEAIPKDWNAANELKTIAIAAAVIHDKRTLIEDLKTSRGIRDLDSEELQAELTAGHQRLLDMRGD